MPPVRRFGSVRQRGRYFEASYWHNGRRHVAPTTFRTKSDALAYLSSVESDIRRGVWIDPFAGRIRVRELAEEWVASNPGKRESTAVREELTVRLHVRPVMGEERIDACSLGMSSSSSTAGAPSTPRAPSSGTTRCCGPCSAMPCATTGLLGLPVATSCCLRSTALVDYELSAADVGRIATNIPERYRVMVWLGATIGLRWSEVAALRVGRFDLAEGRLSVTEAMVRGIGGRNVLSPPKSCAGRRTMFMPDVVTTMLATHLEREGLSEDDADALVFTDDGGGALRYSNWRRRVWEHATASSGCAGAGFHDLRRLNATTLVVEGIDVKRRRPASGTPTRG